MMKVTMKTVSCSILLFSRLLTCFLGKRFPGVSFKYPPDRQLVFPALSLAKVLSPTDGNENWRMELGKFNKSHHSQLAKGQLVKWEEYYTRLYVDIGVAPRLEVNKWCRGVGWLEETDMDPGSNGEGKCVEVLVAMSSSTMATWSTQSSDYRNYVLAAKRWPAIWQWEEAAKFRTKMGYSTRVSALLVKEGWGEEDLYARQCPGCCHYSRHTEFTRLGDMSGWAIVLCLVQREDQTVQKMVKANCDQLDYSRSDTKLMIVTSFGSSNIHLNPPTQAFLALLAQAIVTRTEYQACLGLMASALHQIHSWPEQIALLLPGLLPGGVHDPSVGQRALCTELGWQCNWAEVASESCSVEVGKLHRFEVDKQKLEETELKELASCFIYEDGVNYQNFEAEIAEGLKKLNKFKAEDFDVKSGNDDTEECDTSDQSDKQWLSDNVHSIHPFNQKSLPGHPDTTWVIKEPQKPRLTLDSTTSTFSFLFLDLPHGCKRFVIIKRGLDRKEGQLGEVEKASKLGLRQSVMHDWPIIPFNQCWFARGYCRSQCQYQLLTKWLELVKETLYEEKLWMALLRLVRNWQLPGL